MKLAPEGYPFILVGLLFAGAGWTAAATGFGGRITTGFALAMSILTIFTVWFFRNPTPTVPAGDALVISPAEGKVIEVREVDEPTFMGGRAQRISIFLSVFNVHVQRAPVTGTVQHRVYNPGKFLAAWDDKASEENEQASLGIETTNGRVLVRQIAGLIARRIVTDHDVGDTVERGGRIGLIRFGSRVDLFLPLDWEITCEPGDRVKVGSTVLARQTAEVGR